MKPAITVLYDCIELFRGARGSVAKAMPLLYQIWEKELWKDNYSSLSEFLDECGISRSQASRLITVYARFQGIAEIAEVDPEKLYLAAKLDGTPEEQFAKASTLTRGDLKAEANVKDDGSEHDCVEIRICRICGKRMD